MTTEDLNQIRQIPKRKRHRKEWVYKSEYDKVVAERDKWKRAFMGVIVISALVFLLLSFNLTIRVLTE
jgi:hypothetical protein